MATVEYRNVGPRIFIVSTDGPLLKTWMVEKTLLDPPVPEPQGEAPKTLALKIAASRFILNQQVGHR